MARLPVFDWLPGYDRANLGGDLVAGLTVGAMLIPQAMGYALLAGLPPQIGLYSAVLPLLAYAAIGGSRTLGVGLGSIVLLAALRRWLPNWPGALIVVGLATAAVTAFHLEGHHVNVVGNIPGRLPSLALPTTSFDDLAELVPTALAITMLGFVESIPIAKVFAQRHRSTVKPNRDP